MTDQIACRVVRHFYGPAFPVIVYFSWFLVFRSCRSVGIVALRMGSREKPEEGLHFQMLPSKAYIRVGTH